MPGSVVSSAGRVHVVLVPGFAGFDALGQIEYYAGTTKSYELWLKNGGSPGQAVVLHYFDNLPTAGVATRADRLRTYLAKRIARGEIQDNDRIALVGHSTGGLDIRRLLLPTGQAPPELHVDGGGKANMARRATAIDVDQRKILKKVERVVFISVPQYGTNIADWVRGRATLRRVAIEGLLLAVDGASSPILEEIESCLLGALATLTRKPDLVLAAQDALNETKASPKDRIRRANAEEASSQLRLWLRHAVDDFRAIDDLASFTKPPKHSMSPAHYSESARDHEREQWHRYRIRTMSLATVSRRAFKFKPGELAAPWDLLEPQTRPTRRLAEIAGALASLVEAVAHLIERGTGHDAIGRPTQRRLPAATSPWADEVFDELLEAELLRGASQMDISYLLTNRACAGGFFKIHDSTFPSRLARLCENIANLNTSLFDEAKLKPSGPKRGESLEVWDNDGIVNTVSMLWPNGKDTRLVAADHLDIVGHYVLRKTTPSPDPSGRVYASYDALKSHTEFTQHTFDQVWKDVFDFCVS